MPMIDLALLADTPYRMLMDGVDTPATATIRMLDFAITPSLALGKPDKLEFFFSAANQSVDIDDYGDLQGLIDAVRGTNFPYPDSVAMTPPYSNRLSLNNNRNCFVIYRLSDSKNWQFSHRKPPFSVGDKGVASQVYSGARRVDPTGVADDGTDPANPRPGCKVAYFIADGAKAAAHPDGYVHEFNIHVDLIVEDGAGQASYMPIVIDPDVRHPGGSGA